MTEYSPEVFHKVDIETGVTIEVEEREKTLPDGEEQVYEEWTDYELVWYINDINRQNAQVLMTRDEAGAYTRKYTYGNERLSWDYLGETSGLYVHDGRGSAAMLVDEVTGKTIASHFYDPYGEVQSRQRFTFQPQAGMYDSFRFNGEDFDQSTGLSYLRARYLSVDTAAFISADTYLGSVMEPLTRNLYMYVQGNPVRWTDPSGHRKSEAPGITVITLEDLIKAMTANPADAASLRGNDPWVLARVFLDAYYDPATSNLIPRNPAQDGLMGYVYFYNTSISAMGSVGVSGILPDGTLFLDEKTAFWDEIILNLRIERETVANDDRKAEIDAFFKVWEEQLEKSFNDTYTVTFSSQDLEYYMILDITDRLHEELAGYDAYRILAYVGKPTQYIMTFMLFMDNGSLDYKTQKGSEWWHRGFIYNGEVIARDTVGNIAFGYYMEVVGLSEVEGMLPSGLYNAGKAIKDNKFTWDFIEERKDTYLNNPEDDYWIRYGMQYYFDSKKEAEETSNPRKPGVLPLSQ